MLKKAGYLFQKIDLGLCTSIETKILKSQPASDRIDLPLIAVCGPPRSGTTLTFQIVTQAIDAMVMTNLHYLFYRTPLIGYLISILLTSPYVSNYQSNFGFITGLNGPAQAYLFWQYWCGQHLIETNPKSDSAHLQRFTKLMNAIYRRDGRPFLTGFLAHAFYIDQLTSLFDRCVIIRVKRDMLASARSMLVFRKRKDGSFAETHSAVPREYKLKSSPYEQVAQQAFFINRRLDQQQRRHPDIVFEADYYETCRSPRRFIENLVQFLSERGFPFALRTDVKIPDFFHGRSVNRNQDEATLKIAWALDELVEKYGPVA
jgi:hypothetical protein